MYWQCIFFYFLAIFAMWFVICRSISYDYWSLSFGQHFHRTAAVFGVACASTLNCSHINSVTWEAVNNLQFKQFDRLNLSSKIERFLSNQFESSSHSCNRHPNKAIECFYLFDWLYLIHSSCNTFHFSFDYAEVRARSSEP